MYDFYYLTNTINPVKRPKSWTSEKDLYVWEYELEQFRKSRFTTVFPTVETSSYMKFFEGEPRNSNIILMDYLKQKSDPHWWKLRFLHSEKKPRASFSKIFKINNQIIAQQEIQHYFIWKTKQIRRPKRSRSSKPPFGCCVICQEETDLFCNNHAEFICPECLYKEGSDHEHEFCNMTCDYLDYDLYSNCKAPITVFFKCLIIFFFFWKHKINILNQRQDGRIYYQFFSFEIMLSFTEGAQVQSTSMLI